MLSRTGADPSTLSRATAALPFLIAIGAQLATMLATYAVGKQVYNVVHALVSDEEIKNVPDELQIPGIQQIVLWGIDAAGAFAAVMAPSFGLAILLPQGAGPVASLWYLVTLLLSFGLFLGVLFAKTPGRYLAVFRRRRFVRALPDAFTPVVTTSLVVNALAALFTFRAA